MFPSLRIEGSILTGDIVETIATAERQDGQRPADFGFPARNTVKDEIADAWANARAYWNAYQSKLDRLREGASGVTETRNLWITPLLGLLGYNPELAGKGEVVNGKNYAISHRDNRRDGFPIHIMGWHDSLDKKRQDSGPRMSPHALVQEYVNLTEHLYAIVTNGRQLRLLRNSSRLIKLSFLEFDLERIFNEELFTDFALLFRLLHASRMPVNQASSDESLIERYHQDALDSGSRIRDGLSRAVEDCIRDLANGFLAHEANNELRKSLNTSPTAATEFYQYLLRLIYRLLFLMVIEERGLVFPKSADKRLIDLYHRYYSIGRIRKLSEQRHFAEAKFHDSWDALCATFRLFAEPRIGETLGIAPLGGLFHREAIGPLAKCRLSNAVLLTAIRRLNYFQHPDTRQYMRVNYGALNVEEFGSVYEGLLEFDAKLIEPTPNQYEFHLVKGEGRASSGSHYTPDELVQPLISHSLDYLIADKLKESDPQAALLSLRVADIACGSGHILLAAARRIGTELAILRTGEDQPSPTALREAVRDVIQNCIYGVDLNPLAVELCKVALWLEAHVPGQPLNFLDHHIKCGNAIVGFVHHEELEKGIPMEAFKTLPGDDKEVAANLRKRNKEGRADDRRQVKLALSPENQQKLDAIRQRWHELSGLPERTPAEIDAKRTRFRKFSASDDAWLLQQIAAIPIAQFYQPKTLENKHCVITEQDYRDYLTGQRTPQGQATASAWALAHRKKFFHWFLEFPEIIQNGGFDCILGNPPYQGGQALSGAYGHAFCEYVRTQYAPTGLSDLVAFFLRRIHTLLKDKGFTAFITTNSIKDGDVRKDGLDQVIAAGATINFAVRGIKWPGQANLVVSLVAIHRGEWKGPFELDGRPVNMISSFFEDSENLGDPEKLPENAETVFQGSIFLGDGFLLTHEEADKLRKMDPRNDEVLFPIINGQELNNQPDQAPGRSIINFFDWPMERAQEYEEPFAIVEEKVLPVRVNDNMKSRREKWWQYGALASGLYSNIADLDRCFVAARTTKHLSFSSTTTERVFSDALYVFTTDRWDLYTVVQSTLHEVWARKYSGSLETRLRYSPSDCFSTFAFPPSPDGSGTSLISPLATHHSLLAATGERYHEHRKATMHLLWLGLTKIYNLFHDPNLSPELVAKVSGKPADIAGQGYQALLKLRELHVEMDTAVRDAYGWTDLTLAHGFYDLDYLPENDRTRYTISPEARKEVLQRLLKLNHERHAEEKAAGLHDKKATKAAAKGNRGRKPKADVIIPDDDLFSTKRLRAEISLPASARERGLSDEAWWTRFVYEFIREAGVNASLSRLDTAWQLMAQWPMYSNEFKNTLNAGFDRWNGSLRKKVPVQGFFEHVVTLHENDLIRVEPNSWDIHIPEGSKINQFADPWSNVDAKATLRILENCSDLIHTETAKAEGSLVNAFEVHFKIA
ncbi:MAG: N-6 DNA methylase [Opitutales bacterium]|nr:N-6 DNA methylase [Opitutales bacterium]